ncbi:MAG TPA: hypothetical protein V6C72_00230, partial [Chroococcales cyanobacterium]
EDIEPENVHEVAIVHVNKKQPARGKTSKRSDHLSKAEAPDIDGDSDSDVEGDLEGDGESVIASHIDRQINSEVKGDSGRDTDNDIGNELPGKSRSASRSKESATTMKSKTSTSRVGKGRAVGKALATATGSELDSLISESAQSVLEQLEQDRESINLKVDDYSVPLTHLNKVYWPEFEGHPAVTKRDYLRYLARVSDFAIPHLKDRLITLVRFPNGIDHGRFYQKHWDAKLPKFVQTAPVFTEHENRDQDFLVCANLATLIWLGQLADLELHTSHTRVTAKPDAKNLPEDMTGSVEQLEQSIGNYPDFLVLDMDPYLYSGKEDQGAEPELHRKGFEQCVEIAFVLKDTLDRLKLESFIKTSGKTGLHIYVPIKRNLDYDTVRALSEIICQSVLKERPSAVTMDWAVKKRTDKVFLDHNMNARSKSLASIYSPRVAPAACVSTPIDWAELPNIYPTDFDMRTLPKRLALKGDIWKDILQHKNDMKSIFARQLMNAEVPAKKRSGRGSAKQRT